MKLRISMILIFLVLLTGCNSNNQNIFSSENLPTIVNTSTIESTNTPTPNPTSTSTLTPTNTPTPNPTSTPTLTPTITPTLGPTPIGGSGKILTYCNAGKENGFYELDISTGNYSKQTIKDADLKIRLPVELRLRGTSEKVIGRLLIEDPDQILENCCTEIIGISKDGNEILLSRDGPMVVDPVYLYWITADQPIMKYYISNKGYIPDVQQNDITNVVVINIFDDVTKGGLGNLYSVDLGKGIITTLFKGANKNDEPYWGGFISPDGTKVAYMNNEGIWTIDIDGKNNQMIIPNGYRPDWSPDGKEIVFGKDGKIFTCSEDGSNIKQIILPNSIDNQIIYYPEWVKMPGSQMIDFWSKSGKEWDLFDLSTSQYSIININSDERLDAGMKEGSNKWSPDGKWFITGFMPAPQLSSDRSFLCNVEKHECQQLLIKKSEDSTCFPPWTNWMP